MPAYVPSQPPEPGGHQWRHEQVRGGKGKRCCCCCGCDGSISLIILCYGPQCFSWKYSSRDMHCNTPSKSTSSTGIKQRSSSHTTNLSQTQLRDCHSYQRTNRKLLIIVNVSSSMERHILQTKPWKFDFPWECLIFCFQLYCLLPEMVFMTFKWRFGIYPFLSHIHL